MAVPTKNSIRGKNRGIKAQDPLKGMTCGFQVLIGEAGKREHYFYSCRIADRLAPTAMPERSDNLAEFEPMAALGGPALVTMVKATDLS